MDLTLRSIWEASDTPEQRLVLIHSDASQNSLPLFRQVVTRALKSVPQGSVFFLTEQLTQGYRTKLTTVVLATGVPTASLVPHNDRNLVRLEWSDQVPDYEWKDPRSELLLAVRNGLPYLHYYPPRQLTNACQP